MSSYASPSILPILGRDFQLEDSYLSKAQGNVLFLLFLVFWVLLLPPFHCSETDQMMRFLTQAPGLLHCWWFYSLGEFFDIEFRSSGWSLALSIILLFKLIHWIFKHHIHNFKEHILLCPSLTEIVFILWLKYFSLITVRILIRVFKRVFHPFHPFSLIYFYFLLASYSFVFLK